MRRKLILTALAVVTVLVFAASGSGQTTESLAKSRFTIGFASPVASNPTFAAMARAIQLQAKKLRMKVIVTDANEDANKQISDVDSLIAARVDALLILPRDVKGIQPALARARAKRIPIISTSSGQQGIYTTNIEPNNEGAARAAALYIEQHVGKGAGVGQILGFPQAAPLAARNAGFAAGAKAYGLDVLASQINQTDNADGARPIADAWKTRFGSSMKAVFAYNDGGALGVASASDSSFHPFVVGLTGTQDGIAGIKAGLIQATWDFSPVEQGNFMAWAAYRILTHHSVPHDVVLAMPRIDRKNVKTYPSVDARLKKAMTVKVVRHVAPSGKVVYLLRTH